MLVYETLPIPTPFPVGNINCYLIMNEPITLIDCGVYSVEALEALKKQLKGLGLELQDIRQILITHAHPDHFGLASTIQKYSGAKVYLHKSETKKAKNRSGHLKRIESYLAYYGLPEDIRNQIKAYFKWELGFVQPLEDVIEISDGLTFVFDNAEIQAILTPGHAIGHLCFYERSTGLLFSGDTILGNITPNPVLEPNYDELYSRDQSLVKYADSLKRLKDLPITLILPGHGERLADISNQFQKISVHHQERKNQIKDILKEGILTPYEIACELWPKFKRPVDVYLAISEVLGYIDLLGAEGQITEVGTGSGLLISHI